MQFNSLTEQKKTTTTVISIKMLFRKVFDYCIRCIVWATIMTILTSLFYNSSGVMGQRTKLAFDEEKDVEIVRVATGDNSEQMIVSASNIDRKYSSRSKLFDDIFNVNCKR